MSPSLLPGSLMKRNMKFETPSLLREKVKSCFPVSRLFRDIKTKEKRKIYITAQAPGDNNSKWPFFQFFASFSHSHTTLLPKACSKHQHDRIGDISYISSLFLELEFYQNSESLLIVIYLDYIFSIQRHRGEKRQLQSLSS